MFLQRGGEGASHCRKLELDNVSVERIRGKGLGRRQMVCIEGRGTA